MTNLPEVKKTHSLTEKIENVLMKGDLATLSEVERVQYYKSVCESVGLNPLTQPFSYITLNSKLVLYANKACTDQLRSIHNISIEIVAREKIGDVYVVTARAKGLGGRADESTGAVALGKASGDVLANLFMKAETKAKRRVTLSICGLGLLDESEVESIPGIHTQSEPKPVAQIIELPQAAHKSDSVMMYSPNEEIVQSTNVDDVQQNIDEAIITPANRIIMFGKKYRGQKFREFTVGQIQSYIDWLKNDSAQNGKPLSEAAQKFIKDGEEYILEMEIPF